MGLDKRIGRSFLDAGLGWGGSCFPKDVKALAHMAVIHGSNPQLLQAVMEINRNQRRRVLLRLRKELGGLDQKVIGMLGLSFKPNTDDIREAPALELIHLLENEGATVQAYDPQAMENARSVLPQTRLVNTPYEVAEGADALVLATEWNEFKQLDFERVKGLMRGNLVLDGRNQWDCERLKGLGFKYFGMGRGTNWKKFPTRNLEGLKKYGLTYRSASTVGVDPRVDPYFRSGRQLTTAVVYGIHKNNIYIPPGLPKIPGNTYLPNTIWCSCTYKVLPAARRESSFASLTRCASPPERVVPD